MFTCLLGITTLVLLELTFTFLLNNSSLLSGNLLTHFQNYYMGTDRKIIQYLADCAIYDKELSYILKPGACRIKNREFEVDYLINSLGVRDDESSLIMPKIVVAGDSLAMGWGVKQELTFSSLLQNKLDMGVLNAAISSYGTVRELEILERVDLNNLQYLIIQYGSNDIEENVTFAQNNNVLSIMPEETYLSYQKAHAENLEYYFGKHSLNIINRLFKNIRAGESRLIKASTSDEDEKKITEGEVYCFLNAILNSSIELNNVSVIVFEVNGSAMNDSLFIDTLNKRLISEQPNYPEFKNIYAIDLSPILGSDKYFQLDDHINSSGHAAIAKALAEIIAELPEKVN